MGVTAETADLKIEVARVERVTQARRGLGRPLEGEHAQAPAQAERYRGSREGTFHRILRS